MAMDPDELDQLLGAYALDAVDDVERRLVERYLTMNPRARAEVLEHREVATMLAFSGATAPDGLWDRIAASLDERAPAPGPELARVIPMVDRRRRALRSVGAWAAAAVAAAVIAVVAVQVIDPGSDTSDPLAAAVEQARKERDTRVVQLASEDGSLSVEAVIDPEGHGFLLATDLPALPRDRTYQLWGVVDDRVISLGVLGPTPSTEIFTVKGDLSALVITEEVRGGVPVSEQPAALVGVLT
jgi:anti-sigma-K factor RskA